MTGPNVARLRELAIPNSPLQPPWVSSLLEGEAFPELTGLELAENAHLGPCLTQSLPRANHRRLKRLDVSGVTFQSEQLQQVLTSRCLRTVEELRLAWMSRRPGDPGPLFYLHLGWTLPWSRLRLLDLTGQQVGDEVAGLLASQAEAAHLRWLGLAHNHLTRDGVRKLLESNRLQLYYLDVRGNGLNSTQVAALKQRFPKAIIVA